MTSLESAIKNSISYRADNSKGMDFLEAPSLNKIILNKTKSIFNNPTKNDLRLAIDLNFSEKNFDRQSRSVSTNNQFNANI